MEWEGGEEVEGRKTSARRARVKWTMGGVPSGSTKALVSKPAEVYISLVLETGPPRDFGVIRHRDVSREQKFRATRVVS